MTDLAAILRQLRADLVEEATPLPGQSRSYGRPHQHPRARHFPRYTRSGERVPGATVIGPDCPRPVRGRCECPPDGSWRPSVGVIRADSAAQHATRVPASRLRAALEGMVWVDEVYEKDAVGLWHCRWPVRRALERQRGADPAAWQVAIRLLTGVHPSKAWGAAGVPPNPITAAVRILERIARWAQEERETAWEYRPHQWWDKPRESNARPVSVSESQSIAEHERSVKSMLTETQGAATLGPTGRVRPLPRSTASNDAGFRSATASPAEPSCA